MIKFGAVLEVSASGFHQHRSKQTVHLPRLGATALLVHIKAIFNEIKGAYVWPRVWRELVKDGIRTGKERVRKLMKVHGIQARGKRKFKVTTDSSHSLPVSPNLLERDFAVVQPNRVWTGDITCIQTDEGWLCLAVVIDLLSRQVIGFGQCERVTRQLVIDALRMAWFRRKPAAGLIFHSASLHDTLAVNTLAETSRSS